MDRILKRILSSSGSSSRGWNGGGTAERSTRIQIVLELLQDTAHHPAQQREVERRAYFSCRYLTTAEDEDFKRSSIIETK